MSEQAKCHWDSDLGWLSPEHRSGCDERDCRGCRPCGATHCAMRGRCATHLGTGELTCPGCINHTRKDLLSIEQRMVELPEQAEERGVNSEAVNLHGPANLASPLLPTPYDAEHPLLVLGRWDMMLREDYDQPTRLTLTVGRARGFLDGILVRFANDPEQDFELFSREVAGCLTHLETVLDDSRQPERGAPCPRCRDDDPDQRAPRLTKVWAERAADDKWQCPRIDGHKWGDVDYRNWVDEDYLEHAETLTADNMHRQHHIKPGTLRKWAERDLVAKRGKDGQGRMLYDVAQAVKMRDTRDVA